MTAIADAIKSCDAVVAIIDQKFAGSIYCTNELAMALSNGKKLFPILFRDMQFDMLPDGLQYMLASTQCHSFSDDAADQYNITLLQNSLRSYAPGATVVSTNSSSVSKQHKLQNGSWNVGTPVLLRGTGRHYDGQVCRATVCDVDTVRGTVKIQYADGGFRRLTCQEFERLLAHPVLLAGTGRRYEGRVYRAIVVDVRASDGTVKVQYECGGFKRFSRTHFQKLLKEAHLPEMTPHQSWAIIANPCDQRHRSAT